MGAVWVQVNAWNVAAWSFVSGEMQNRKVAPVSMVKPFILKRQMMDMWN